MWTTLTALVMFVLAYGKRRVGASLENSVMMHESSVTVVDGLLVLAVLVGLVLNILFGWWWADACAALVLVSYAAWEIRGVTHDLAQHPTWPCANHGITTHSRPSRPCVAWPDRGPRT